MSRRRTFSGFFSAIFLTFMPLSWGCLSDLSTPERRKKGLVIVLPGIEGRSVWNYNLARGLNDGGIDCAIELFPWGTKVPGGFLLNLADEHRNRIEAERLRDYLIRYQQTHPGRSVHLVGHSGGAGLAVMATERLPLDAPVTSVTLLAAAISPSYDLRSALRRTELGILNCYSGRDSILLGPGTILVGTIDRQHVEAAGKVGFDQPDVLSKGDEGLFKKLRQVPWTPPLRQVGHDGGHFGWTNRHFVRNWLAPSMKGFIDRVHPITK